MPLEELLRTFQAFDAQCHEFLSSFHTPHSKFSTINDPPSPSEIPQIQDIVSLHQKQLSAIDAIVQRMKSAADHLNDEREQIVSSMKTHKSFLSCIRRFPSEILEEIFTRCLPNETYLIPNRRSAPLLLTEICRRWREVALDTPRLWCSLLIPPTGEEHLGLYRDWLQKAKHSPLSLCVSLVPEAGRELWPSMALDFTQLYTSRCIEFKVTFDVPYSLHVLLKDVPILESLYIIGEFHKIGPEYDVSIVQPLPRLRTLIIDSMSSPPDPFMCDLGWTNLTTLSVRFDSDRFSFGARSRPLLQLLRMCPNLENLMCGPFPTYTHGVPLSFTHQKLRVLHLKGLANSSMIFYRDTLELPKLVYLCIDERSRPDCDHDIDPHFHDTPMLQFSPPLSESGRTLDIAMRCKFNDVLFTVLQPGWKEITHLGMEVTHIIDKETLRMLIRDCPNLESLTVFSDTGDIDEVGAIFGYIPHDTLRSLTVDIRRDGPSHFRILDMFTFPNLRHLDLRLGFRPKYIEYLIENLQRLLARSREPPLEILKIRGMALTAYERKRLASLAPTGTADIRF